MVALGKQRGNKWPPSPGPPFLYSYGNVDFASWHMTLIGPEATGISPTLPQAQVWFAKEETCPFLISVSFDPDNVWSSFMT